MSQAEELLNMMSSSMPVHSHPVPDTDTYFVIDPITRKIENTNRKKSVVMQYDHNSERFTFELPRYIDGHDMLECTSITVNVDNIEAVESNNVEVIEPRINSDAPDMTDLQINPEKPDTVISSWLISRNLTQLAGILSFSIEYKCVDSSGNVVYEWSTDKYEEIEVKSRKKNGEAAVIEHTDLLEQWRSQIFGAGDSVMANIAAEGEAQVTAVKNESETQQEAVELKGTQTLETIPEEYTQTSNTAKEAIRTKGDAIVCNAEGESIVLTDASDNHVRGLKVFGKSSQFTTTGKNLISQPYVENLLVNNNVTFTVNADYSITTNVTSAGATVNTAFRLFGVGVADTQQLPSSVVPGETYTFSAGRVLPTGMSMAVYFYDSDQTAISSFLIHETSSVTFKVPAAAVSWYGYIRIAEGAVVSNTTVYPMIELGDTATSYEPYTGGLSSPNPEYPQNIVSVENPTVDVYGKNLAHPVGRSRVVNGYTITPNEDGTVTIGGAAAEAVDTVLDLALIMATSTYEVTPLKANVAYELTCWKDGVVTETPGTKQLLADGTIKWGWTSVETQDRSIIKLYRQFVPEVGATDVCGTYATQIEVGSERTDYTPYVNQKLTIDNALSGIPVSEGGNYTDPDGQQWICDEIDLERGVYVQRIGSVTFTTATTYIDTAYNDGSGVFYVAFDDYDSRSSTLNMMCDKLRFHGYTTYNAGATSNMTGGHFAYIYNATSAPRIYFAIAGVTSLDTANEWMVEHRPTIYYPKLTTIETPLTAEEITAFKALRTNYPSTTILNDAGAWMSVKYNADTKSYIDNPKSLKLVDSSTGVVYELKIVDGSLTVVPVQ